MDSNEPEEFKKILLDKFYCGAEDEDNCEEERQLAVKLYNDNLSKRLIDDNKLNLYMEQIKKHCFIINRNVTKKTFLVKVGIVMLFTYLQLKINA